MKKKIALIFGGQSTEHDVSVVSAASIAQSLDQELFEPVYVAIDKAGRWFAGAGSFDLLKGKGVHDVTRVILSTDPERKGLLELETGNLIAVDAVFPVLHGPRGEDGTLQGMLDLAGIPYVGCGTMASAIAIDKDMTKRVLAQCGIPVTKGTSVSRWMWEKDKDDVLAEIKSSLQPPFFVKPATMGSSVGITKVHSYADLEKALPYALSFSHHALVEQAVPDALEIEVAILGNNDPKASIAGQVVPGGDFYDFDAKYVDNSSQLLIPAQISTPVADKIRFLAREAFIAIGGTGLARVDFLVSDEHLYLNEINTLPGFTSISMYPKLWEATGITYPDLITKLIDLAFARHQAEESLTKTIELERGLGV